MKLFRTLVYHLQFWLVIIVTASLVVGVGMLGQYWFDNQDTVPVSESVSPQLSPSPDNGSKPAGPSPLPSDLTQFPKFPTQSAPPLATPSIPASPVPNSSPAPPASPSPSSSPAVVAVKPNRLYGHLPYPVIGGEDLVIAGDYYGRKEKLHRETAAAFKKMVAAARGQGVTLKLASGFRSKERQKKLFDRQLQRKGSKQEAAKWSAPPGYSEHHTGYALDIGDGKATDFQLAFEKTKAYQWLIKNASQYGFELSFPRGNPQGVSFEPWHWRYVGTEAARSVFQIAKGNV